MTLQDGVSRTGISRDVKGGGREVCLSGKTFDGVQDWSTVGGRLQGLVVRETYSTDVESDSLRTSPERRSRLTRDSRETGFWGPRTGSVNGSQTDAIKSP